MSSKRKQKKAKNIIKYLIIAILLFDAGVFGYFELTSHAKADTPISQTAQVKSVDSQIIVNGTVTAQDQATLHFQTGGKLAYLPVKEGDKVRQGQTIARLDTYALQRELTQALSSYVSARNGLDQAQIDQSKGITQNVKRGQDNFYDSGLLTTNVDTSTINYLNDLADRIVKNDQSNVNSSVAQVEIRNYAIQMASITSPLTGIVTHEDVNVAGQNVTPQTGFTVADPTTKVFRADVPASYIDFVHDGMQAKVILDGMQNRVSGTIVKIYPSKITLATGESVYQVDIQSNAILNASKLDQTGTAVIMTNAQNVMLIPAWTVLAGKYVWIDNSGKPELKQITVGKTHGNDIEVTGGLTKSDRVITDPKAIPSTEYPFL